MMREPSRTIGAKPEIDYLAKDFASFRQLMLDQLAVHVPQWSERNPSDIGNALVEVLAYAADHLSYYQDAVATESYLGTARRRTSVRRHARLVDYQLHEGCNARAWVQVRVEGSLKLQRGTQFLTRFRGQGADPPASFSQESEVFAEALRQGAKVFESMHDVDLHGKLNEIEILAPASGGSVLPAGSTALTLADSWDFTEEIASLIGGVPKPGRDLDALRVGDVLVLRETRDSRTGETLGVNQEHRHAVRITALQRSSVEDVVASSVAGESIVTKVLQQATDEQMKRWRGPSELAAHVATSVLEQLGHKPVPWVRIAFDAVDALPFDLQVGRDVDGRAVSHALGNMVLADHGRTLQWEELEAVRPGIRYRPELMFGGVTYCVPLEFRTARDLPAKDLQAQNPAGARAAVQLVQRRADFPLRAGTALQPVVPPPQLGESVTMALSEAEGWDRWRVRRDLLSSDQFARDFVVEASRGGRSRIRFGFGSMGRVPLAGDHFAVRYRVGHGVDGNVGIGALGHVVTPLEGVIGVGNPVPARGGVEPEPLDRARLRAPYSFRDQLSCVTPADYVDLAKRHPAVAEAMCQIKWVGSGRVAELYIRRKRGLQVDEPFARSVMAFLEPYLVLGTQLTVRAPREIALDLQLAVYLEASASAHHVEHELRVLLVGRGVEDGPLPLFDSRVCGLGSPVHASDVIERVMRVAGVVRVDTQRFCRLGARRNLESITLAANEVALVDGDPTRPHRGRLRVQFKGGR